MIHGWHQIKPGSKLIPCDDFVYYDPVCSSYGTLGFLAIKDDGDSNCDHIAVTAGHVLDEAGADSVYVETSADGSSQRQLNPVKGCERFLGRPRFRLRWTHPRPCLDEICLLELPVGEDYRTLCKFPLDVDFRAIFPPVIAEYTSSKDPLDIDPIELQR